MRREHREHGNKGTREHASDNTFLAEATFKGVICVSRTIKTILSQNDSVMNYAAKTNISQKKAFFYKLKYY